MENHTVKQKKMLLCGYFGYGNAGDEAGLGAAIKLLGERGVSSCVAFNPVGDFSEYAELGAERCNRFSVNELKRALADCEALVLAGGNLFQNETSNRSLLYYCAVTALAKKSGRRVLMLSSGIGRIKNGMAARFARGALSAVSFAGMRTAEDLEEAERYLSCPIINMPDLVFSQKPRSKEKRDQIAVIPMGNPTEIISEARRLRAEGLEPVVIPFFINEDSGAAVRIGEELGCEVFFSQRADEIIERLAHCRLSLTERLHGAVFSMIASTPTVILSDSQKCERFARETAKRARKLNTPCPVIAYGEHSIASEASVEYDFSSILADLRGDLLSSLDSLFA